MCAIIAHNKPLEKALSNAAKSPHKNAPTTFFNNSEIISECRKYLLSTN